MAHTNSLPQMERTLALTFFSLFFERGSMQHWLSWNLLVNEAGLEHTPVSIFQ